MITKLAILDKLPSKARPIVKPTEANTAAIEEVSTPSVVINILKYF